MANEPDEEDLLFHAEQGPIEAGVEKIFCFMDSNRLCGAECMAYITFPRASKATELSEAQQHCSLLMAADRLGRNTTIIASLLSEGERRRHRAQVDAKREANTPRPDGPFAQPTSPFPKRTT